MHDTSIVDIKWLARIPLVLRPSAAALYPFPVHVASFLTAAAQAKVRYAWLPDSREPVKARVAPAAYLPMDHGFTLSYTRLVPHCKSLLAANG